MTLWNSCSEYVAAAFCRFQHILKNNRKNNVNAANDFNERQVLSFSIISMFSDSIPSDVTLFVDSENDI
ncbi:hypothetical protein ABEB36_003771 [Hypothenemus hampei]|uniref:Uncharacterized protein n=1 Tax=Hypothenemus hampei TaxID=57062 RepID=A0ABD1F132_HYPHA